MYNSNAQEINKLNTVAMIIVRFRKAYYNNRLHFTMNLI